jgi:hypothetical protein
MSYALHKLHAAEGHPEKTIVNQDLLNVIKQAVDLARYYHPEAYAIE